MKPMSFESPRRMPQPQPDHAPIVTPNTTPLIDVMLVLLIMMILAIPAARHKLPVDMPTAGQAGPASPLRTLNIASSGALTLDGQGLDRASLHQAMVTMAKDPARPGLRLQTDPAARYADFNATLAVVRNAGVSRIGFVGNEAMRDAI